MSLSSLRADTFKLSQNSTNSVVSHLIYFIYLFKKIYWSFGPGECYIRDLCSRHITTYLKFRIIEFEEALDSETYSLVAIKFDLPSLSLEIGIFSVEMVLSRTICTTDTKSSHVCSGVIGWMRMSRLGTHITDFLLVTGMSLWKGKHSGTN